MPAFISHALFAEDVVHFMSEEDKALIFKHYNTYIIGAQGPDLFFYQRVLETNIGRLLHTKHTRAFLVRTYEYMREHAAEEVRAYFLGFLTHYAYDSIAHPYVFSVTGNYAKEHTQTAPFIFGHTHLEYSIDKILFEQHHGQELYTYDTAKHYLYHPFFSKEIIQYMDRVLEDIYDITIGSVISRQSIRRCYAKHRSMYDPRKSKYTLLSNLRNDTRVITSFMYSSPLYNFDYLNLSNKPWVHPVTQEIHRESFYDLQLEAIHRFVELYTFVSSADKEPLYLATAMLTELFPNVSYLTGLDLDLPQKMNHFSVRIYSDGKHRSEAKGMVNYVN